MDRSLVLLVIGPDRPGIVTMLSEAVARHQGNWQESRMVHLADQFAGVVRLTVPEAQVASLTESLNALREDGLEVTVRPSEAIAKASARRLVLKLVGTDRPGIVQRITATLSEQGANVEELATEAHAAPMSGDSLFSATVTLTSDTPEPTLRQALEKIAGDLMVDIEIAEPT